MSAPGNTLETVKEVARLVKEAGGRALLVGGCVRDSLLGDSAGIKDYDLEVYGLEGEKLERALSSRFKLDLVGRSFGVVKLHHYDIDVALPRRETKLGAGHRAFGIDSDPFMPIEDAAARRDFTINAIYRDPLTGMYILLGSSNTKDGKEEDDYNAFPTVIRTAGNIIRVSAE